MRSNLSALRAQLKKDANAQAYAQAETFAEENKSLFWNWLESDDAKTRKNAALLLKTVYFLSEGTDDVCPQCLSGSFGKI